MTTYTPRSGVDPEIDALAQCRSDIDRIDAVLAALLRERTRLARIFASIIDETRAPQQEEDVEAAQ